ncbi:putative lipoprotein [Granulibacter bethesdensis]|nr:putative lipoprotein [Granulibacter bethesdensis]
MTVCVLPARSMLKRLSRHPGIQSAGAWLLRAWLHFALTTTRWQWEGEEHVATFLGGDSLICAFWHEQLALMPKVWLRFRKANPEPCHVIISQHRDGRLVATLMRLLGAKTLNGSSSRGGATVLRDTLRILDQGGRIIITPDGPRGPRRQAAPGATAIAAMSGRPLLPVAAQISRRLVLKSWDRMVVPMPFGRGAVVVAAPIRVERDDMRYATARLEEALNHASDQANRLCGLAPDAMTGPSASAAKR